MKYNSPSVINVKDLNAVQIARIAGLYVPVHRPSKWGNPFKLEHEADREFILEQYEEWLLQQPHLLAALPELRGKVLGCYCSPKPCHGDILLRLANQ